MTADNTENKWDEETSQRYIDYGRYFVPDREGQMRIMVQLVKGCPQPCNILELCCGEGLLAELLLAELPGSAYQGMDGSPLMLEKARLRLARFGERAQLSLFDLGERSWRKTDRLFQAVVSSLAIHHLDGMGKQLLFKDVSGMLDGGGVFIIADIIEPVTPAGRSVSAQAWDEVVRQRSIALDGNTAGLDFFRREGWNTYRYQDPDDIDHPSPLLDQLSWLAEAGFMDIDVHFIQAGHALFSGWKHVVKG